MLTLKTELAGTSVRADGVGTVLRVAGMTGGEKLAFVDVFRARSPFETCQQGNSLELCSETILMTNQVLVTWMTIAFVFVQEPNALPITAVSALTKVNPFGAVDSFEAGDTGTGVGGCVGFAVNHCRALVCILTRLRLAQVNLRVAL